MAPINSANASSPPTSSITRGLFETISDTISGILFPKAAHDRELLNEFANWKNRQKPNVTVVMPETETLNGDEVKHFLQVFLSNLALKIFDTSVVDQIKTVISKGLNETLKMQAEAIVKFLVVDSITTPPDLTNPKNREFLDKGTSYLFKYTGGMDDKKQVIESALQMTADRIGQVLDSVNLDDLATNNCSLVSLRRQFADKISFEILKSLGKILAEKMVKSERFGKAFEEATFQALRPVVERVLKSQLPQISSTVKLFADIGSHLIGERISELYNSMNIRDVLDQVITKANSHVDAYKKVKSNRDLLASFAEEEGCHPVAKAIIKRSNHPVVLKDYFTEFSNTFVEFLLDERKVDAFISSLESIRGDLNKAKDPFVEELVRVLLMEENKPLLKKAIGALKPVLVPMIAEFLANTGIKTLFPRDRIYKLIFGITEPIWDLMRRVIIERLVSTMLDDAEFIALFASFDQAEGSAPSEQLINKVIQIYENTFNKTFFGGTTPIEETMKAQIPASLQGLKKVLKPNTNCKAKLKAYFDLPFRTYGNAPYGQLIMNVVFGIPGGAASLAQHSSELERLLGAIFQDGVAPLRCVTSADIAPEGKSNDLLFQILKPAIDPFKSPEEVEKLLEQSNPWTEHDIKTRTAIESAVLSDLLLKIIKLAPGGNVYAPLLDLAGLKRQIEVVFDKLFAHDEVNYNLWFNFLDILKEQFKPPSE